MAGSTNYPGAVDSFGNVTDHVDVVDDDHINDLRRAVEAIETELGINPPDVDDTIDAVSAAADIALRLDHIANMLKTITGQSNWYTDPIKSIAQLWTTLSGISGITRRLFVPAFGAYANATSWDIAARSTYRAVLLDAANEECYFSFQVPADYSSGATIKLAFIPTAYWSWPDGSFTWSASLYQSIANVSHTNWWIGKSAQDSGTVTGGDMEEITLFESGLLLSVAAGHYAGLRFTLDSLNIITEIYVVGLVFEYTSR